MRTIFSLVFVAFAMVLSACAGLQDGPSSEQRNTLAPTGKLRVGFLATTPIHATKDAVSGEFKGPAVDLGKEMARRIGVLEKSSPDAFLSRTIQRATLVRVASIANMLESLNAGRVDAIYATKANMLAESAKMPGSRVLEGRSGGEEAAVAVPKGRQLGVVYARQVVDEAVANGLVKAAIERAGLRGVVVAPQK